MKSMTGFASVSGTGDGVDWRWEVRSVNGRGLDLKIRCPSGFEALESRLKGMAQASLARGSISGQLTLRYQSASAERSVDLEALEFHVEILCAVRAACENRSLPLAPVSAEMLVPMLAGQSSNTPVVQPDPASMTKTLVAGFERVLAALVSARETEGEALSRLIAGHLARIESLVRDAEKEAQEAVAILRERTLRQVRDLVGEELALDAGRLEQEIAMVAAKADVREEIDRLDAHCVAAAALIEAGQPVGRRLDFLTQEFIRETNTICSKSATQQLTRIGLDLKTAIEQLREQAANVE